MPVHEFPYIFGGYAGTTYFESFDIDINGNIFFAGETWGDPGTGYIDVAPMILVSPQGVVLWRKYLEIEGGDYSCFYKMGFNPSGSIIAGFVEVENTVDYYSYWVWINATSGTVIYAFNDVDWYYYAYSSDSIYLDEQNNIFFSNDDNLCFVIKIAPDFNDLSSTFLPEICYTFDTVSNYWGSGLRKGGSNEIFLGGHINSLINGNCFYFARLDTSTNSISYVYEFDANAYGDSPELNRMEYYDSFSALAGCTSYSYHSLTFFIAHIDTLREPSSFDTFELSDTTIYRKECMSIFLKDLSTISFLVYDYSTGIYYGSYNINT